MSGPNPSHSNPSTIDRVPLLDVNRGNEPLLAEMETAISEVLRSGQFVLGPAVQQLEESVASYCETEHAIGCGSGSDALLLALMALEIGPGDEVIVPSFSFFATASAVWRVGAKVVFADIDPVTFNLDPASVVVAVTEKTKAIIPVHLFGQCADMDAIQAIAHRHDLAVIEDAAQALGARFQDKPAGSIGNIGCFSFYPTKNLGGCGDGGMLTTNDSELAHRLRVLRNHGMEPRYNHPDVGVNSRLDSFQAAALNVKLPHLDRWAQNRQQNAERYHQLFAELGLDTQLSLPTTDPRCHHVWNQYTIRIPQNNRDRLREELASKNIGSEVYYPIPLHRQPCFEALGYQPEDLPVTETAAQAVLSLPIFPELTEREQCYTVSAIAEAFANGLSTPAATKESATNQLLRSA